MRAFTRLTGTGELAVLSDANRVAVLRLLMSSPATVTQVGAALGKYPAWARHHVKVLEAAGLVTLVEERKTDNYTEKYYQASAPAYAVDVLIRPEGGPVLALASHDLALEALAEGDTDEALSFGVTGSLDALVALRQGLADIAGCHLVDPASGEYNVPYVRMLFPGRRMNVVTLAHREQGLIVAEGNPLGLRGIEDVAARGAEFANRNPGSGTRLWVDRELTRLGIAPERVSGYDREVTTHTGAAQAVATGQAQAAVGLRLAAERFGLGWVPLFSERYDLIVPEGLASEGAVGRLLERVSSSAFRKRIGGFSGYDTEHSGECVTSA